MSTAKQEDSPERQLAQLLPYVQAKGYAVVGDPYLDPGVAGDELERRPAFRRLLTDAQAGQFNRILVDDLSRLGRFDALTWGEVLNPLRRAGVTVETVSKGELRWNDFGSRLMAVVEGEQRHGEQRNLSRNVLTGMARKAAEGAPLGGRPPYGYRWEGNKLVPDGSKAEAVRLMFQWATEGHSTRWIAAELRKRGVPNPTGGDFWHGHTVRGILRNRRYVGDLTWGAVSQGKFWGLYNGKVDEQQGLPRRRHVHNDEWFVAPDRHEPLVDRETFAAAQAAVAGRQGRTTPLPDGGEFLLSGLLVCDHCGSFLVGTTRKGRGKDSHTYRVYRCGGYIAHGRDYCRGHNLHEAPLARLIIRRLRESYLDPERLAVLRREFETDLAGDDPKAARGRLERRVKELSRDIDTAAGNLALTAPDLRPHVEAKLRELLHARRACEAELAELTTRRPLEEFDTSVERVRAGLMLMERAMQGKNAPLLRQTFREWVVRVECRSEATVHDSGRVTYAPAGGVIVVRPDILLGNLLTSDRRHCSRR
jgi:site-specific DNA recombinase